MKDYNDFVFELGKRESGNNYSAKNQFGFLGRWQFGKPRLYDLGYSIDGWKPNGRPAKNIISEDYFLTNPELQDRLMKIHVGQLARQVKQRFPDQLATIIQGVEVTVSGCVAGIHLKGIGSAKRDVPNSKQGLRHFLLWNLDPIDGNGTKISEYIRKFGGFDLREVDDRIVANNKLLIPIKLLDEIEARDPEQWFFGNFQNVKIIKGVEGGTNEC